jgi:hypothetical protein
MLFGSTLVKHGSHLTTETSLWTSHAHLLPRLCCYLVIHIENLLRPLQLFYFRLWSIYWLSPVYVDRHIPKPGSRIKGSCKLVNVEVVVYVHNTLSSTLRIWKNKNYILYLRVPKKYTYIQKNGALTYALSSLSSEIQNFIFGCGFIWISVYKWIPGHRVVMWNFSEPCSVDEFGIKSFLLKFYGSSRYLYVCECLT